MAKAQELGIKILYEDDFLKIIKDSNEKKVKNEHSKKVKKEKDHNRKSSKDKDKNRRSRHHSSSSIVKIEISDVKREKSDHKPDKYEQKERSNRKEPEIKKEKSEHKYPTDSSKTKLEIKEKSSDKSKSSSKADVVKIENNLKSNSESKSSVSMLQEDTRSGSGITVFMYEMQIIKADDLVLIHILHKKGLCRLLNKFQKFVFICLYQNEEFKFTFIFMG